MSIKETSKEIKVRYLSPSTVMKLDELAKKSGLSRNDYLKKQLELLAFSSELFEIEDKYHWLCERAFKVLDYNTIALNKFLEENLIDLEEAVLEKIEEEGNQ